MNKKTIIYILCFYLATCFFGCSGCKALRKLTDSERKANLVASSSTSGIQITWTKNSTTGIYTPTTPSLVSITFNEISGETSVSLTSYSISYSAADGTDLSSYYKSDAGMSLYIKNNSSASTSITIVGDEVLTATGYSSTRSTPTMVSVNITFYGKDGVGNSISVPFSITISHILTSTSKN